jgi:hypothetical protein
MELRVRCRRAEEPVPGLRRFRLASTIVRGQPLGGTDIPAAAAAGRALTPETTAAPPAGNTGRPWPAPPGRGASGEPVSGAQTDAQEPKVELAFDSQKGNRNHENPLTGRVHASRRLPQVPTAFRNRVVRGQVSRRPRRL